MLFTASYNFPWSLRLYCRPGHHELHTPSRRFALGGILSNHCPLQTPGMMGFEQVSLLPSINGKPESLYYFTNPVCLLDRHGPWGKQQQEGLFWRECREEFL